jgi:hypothetical protein
MHSLRGCGQNPGLACGRIATIFCNVMTMIAQLLWDRFKRIRSEFPVSDPSLAKVLGKREIATDYGNPHDERSGILIKRVNPVNRID